MSVCLGEISVKTPTWLQPYVKGRLQSKYDFVLKAAFLYANIPAKTNFLEKFIF